MCVGRGIVGRFVQDCEFAELLIATTTALATALGASTLES